MLMCMGQIYIYMGFVKEKIHDNFTISRIVRVIFLENCGLVLRNQKKEQYKTVEAISLEDFQLEKQARY